MVSSHASHEHHGVWSSSSHIYETRKRGATHAWERRQHRQTWHPRAQQQHTSGTGRHYDPFVDQQSNSTSSTYNQGFGAGARRSPRLDREERERREHDRVVNESSVVRFVQVMGLVLLISSVVGGLSASAH